MSFNFELIVEVIYWLPWSRVLLWLFLFFSNSLSLNCIVLPFPLSTICSTFKMSFLNKHFYNLLSWVTRYVYFFHYSTAFAYRCYGIHTPFTFTRAILCCFASTQVFVCCTMRTWKSLGTLIVSLQMEPAERRCRTFEIWLENEFEKFTVNASFFLLFRTFFQLKMFNWSTWFMFIF